MSTILMFVGILLMLGEASSHYNKSYDGYTFILPDPLPDRTPMQLSFFYAQRWCAGNVAGSTLATILNRYVQQNFNRFIESALQNKNLDRSNYDNIRLNGKFHFTNEWRWVSGRPKTAGITFHERNITSILSFTACIIEKSIRIYSEGDKKSCFFICEYPGNSEHCDMPLNGRCYQKKDNWLQWFEARNICLEGGGDLASFETLNDTNISVLLNNLSLSPYAEHCYSIGLQKNEWRWADTGSAIKYANWYYYRKFDSNLRCLCLTYDRWEWKGCDCSKSNPFICLIKDMPSSSAQGTSTTADMPNSPTQEASTTTETIKLAILVVSCAVIFVVIIIIAAALIVKKRKNSDAQRAEIPSGYVIPKHAVTEPSVDFPVYEEIIQNPKETNIPASDTTYASVVRKVVAKTEEEHPVNSIVYAELDLKLTSKE